MWLSMRMRWWGGRWASRLPTDFLSEFSALAKCEHKLFTRYMHCVCVHISCIVYISLMCDYAARHVRRIWNNRRIARFAIRFALRWCPCAFATRHFSVLNQKSEVLAKSFSPVMFAQPASTLAATLWTGLTFWICILIPCDCSWSKKSMLTFCKCMQQIEGGVADLRKYMYSCLRSINPYLSDCLCDPTDLSYYKS